MEVNMLQDIRNLLRLKIEKEVDYTAIKSIKNCYKTKKKINQSKTK